MRRAAPPARGTRASAAAILGQGLAHWTIYVPAMLLYFVIMPRVYGFSTLGSFWQIVTLSFPFILATSFLGQTLGLVFRHRETAVLLVLATSLPQFFLVGAAWPAEAIPSFLRSARELLPSVSAIDGFVRINQMGADLLEVRGRWETLWVLTLLYFATAAALAYLRRAAELCDMRPPARVAYRCWRSSRWPRWRTGTHCPRQADAPGPLRAWYGRRKSRSRRRSAAALARVLVAPGQHVNKGGDASRCSATRNCSPPSARHGRRRTRPPPRATASMPACATNRSNRCAAKSSRRRRRRRSPTRNWTGSPLWPCAPMPRCSSATKPATRPRAPMPMSGVAQARYAEAQLGPTAEERALADAQLRAAEAARDVVEARAAKMLLRAPAAGEIGLVVPEIGEAVIPGETVLTLIPERRRYGSASTCGRMRWAALRSARRFRSRRRVKLPPGTSRRCATGASLPRGGPPARMATTI